MNISFKGWENILKPVNSDIIKNSKLMEEAKEYLKSNGLPERNDLLQLMNFYFTDSLINIIKNNGNNYIAIGDDFGTKICISEDDGHVYSIDEKSEFPMRFINSNITSLLECLNLFENRRNELEGISDEEASQIITSIKDQMIKYDSNTFNNAENWWSLIIEQTEQGLM